MPLSMFPPPSPALPDFVTLLVKGEYPPSSPIHLCLSHLRDLLSLTEENSYGPNKALIICCEEERKAVERLQQFNDEWLNHNAGLGEVSHLLSNVDILYAPTAERLFAMLSLLRPSVRLMGRSPGSAKMVLDPPPSLVLLQNPSNYFMDVGPLTQTDTLSDYLTIVLEAMSCTKYLCSGQSSRTARVRFALFDCRLGELSLPIVPKTREEEVPHQDEEEGDSPRSSKSTEDEEDASLLADGYFEWVGKMRNVYTSRYDEEADASSPPDFKDIGSTHYMKLTRHAAYEGDESESEIYMEWKQEDGDENVWNGLSGTRFSWAAVSE